MAYMVGADVNSFGFLYGGDGNLPKPTASHSWYEPYPVIPGVLDVSWEQGEALAQPNVLLHSRLRDFVIDETALRVLRGVIGSQLHAYARLAFGGIMYSAIQAIDVLDVVDAEHSIPTERSWQDFAFPHIPEAGNIDTKNRLFRIPNRGFMATVFVGDDVKRAWEEAGLVGWFFNEARVSVDDWDLGTKLRELFR